MRPRPCRTCRAMTGCTCSLCGRSSCHACELDHYRIWHELEVVQKPLLQCGRAMHFTSPCLHSPKKRGGGADWIPPVLHETFRCAGAKTDGLRTAFVFYGAGKPNHNAAHAHKEEEKKVQRIQFSKREKPC